MIKATKVRIYPNPEQAVFLNRQFGAVRFVYNRALSIKSHAYKTHQCNLSLIKDIKPLLAIAKKNRRYAWLKGFDSMALMEAVRNLDVAYKRFFDPKIKAGHPKYKSKRGKQTSYHCGSVKVLDGAIKIPKMQPIKARLHREIKGEVRSITLSRTPTGKYYAAILHRTDEIAPEKPKRISVATGYDIGLSHILISDKGDKTDNPRFLKNAERNLKRKQQALSRCKKGSHNRAKARLLFAKVHERVAFARNDFQHKLSSRITDENQAVILETLKASNMLKNKRLAKHISDAAWHGLVSKVEYKAKNKGVHFVKISQWYASSKTCSQCDYKLENLKLDVRDWQCPSCGAHHDRDINAAMNIKREGLKRLTAEGLSVAACGGSRKSGVLSAAA